MISSGYGSLGASTYSFGIFDEYGHLFSNLGKPTESCTGNFVNCFPRTAGIDEWDYATFAFIVYTVHIIVFLQLMWSTYLFLSCLINVTASRPDTCLASKILATSLSIVRSLGLIKRRSGNLHFKFTHIIGLASRIAFENFLILPYWLWRI